MTHMIGMTGVTLALHPQRSLEFVKLFKGRN